MSASVPGSDHSDYGDYGGHGEDLFRIAEAALIKDPDLALYSRAGFSNVRTGELVIVYRKPDFDRYNLEDDGTLAPLYTGQRYDSHTLAPKGQPRRSNDPADLRQWWRKVTGSLSSSPALTWTDGEG